MLLAGDIGGTKTNLALFEADGDLHQPVEKAKFPSSNYSNLSDIVREFLLQTKASVNVAAFGIAGPVVDGVANVTNLGWMTDERVLASNFDLVGVKLLNDLVATANAIPILEKDDLHMLNEGKVVAETAIGVIAPGTGLGEAYLTWDGTGYRPFPSEGGHASFSPADAEETELLTYLANIYGHVSTERVCSGSGIPNIYNFLKDSKKYAEPEWLSAELKTVTDPAPTIINHALNTPDLCALCTKTLELFVKILGAETGDLVLTFLATGGIYLGGGIPPRILPALESDHFREAFCDKGRFTDTMKNIPVHVILNSEAALLGAARAAFDLHSRI